jgi:hypothetical protein
MDMIATCPQEAVVGYFESLRRIRPLASEITPARICIRSSIDQSSEPSSLFGISKALLTSFRQKENEFGNGVLEISLALHNRLSSLHDRVKQLGNKPKSKKQT